MAFQAGRVVTVVLPGGDRPAPRADAPSDVLAFLARVVAWFEGDGREVVDEAMCDAAGRTPFEREVYRLVSSIPVGETRTYGEMAAAAGHPGAARAVGAAMARNPFAPLIPCHRLVGSDGSLRGYGGGLEMKAALLSEEGARV